MTEPRSTAPSDGGARASRLHPRLREPLRDWLRLRWLKLLARAQRRATRPGHESANGRGGDQSRDASQRPSQERVADTLYLQAACFTCGALLVLALPQLPAAKWLLLAGGPALVPWRWRRHYAVLMLGVLMTFWQAQDRLDQRWPAARSGDDVVLQGSVASLPDAERAEPPRRAATAADPSANSGVNLGTHVGANPGTITGTIPGANAAANVGANPSTDQADIKHTWHFLFEPDANARAEGVPACIRASWYRSEAILKGGQCWRFTLRLRAPHGSRNPGGADYEAYLFRQGIGAIATVRDAQPCARDAGYRLLRLRQAITDQIHDWLPGHPAEPLIAALAVADKTGLQQADWDTFRQTGTVHVMVIAGLHVGFVAAFAFWLGRWLWSLSPRLCLRWPAQRAGLAASVIVAIAYALLADLDAPVLRATLMLLIFAAAAWAGGAARAGRALALAWLVVVGLDPIGLLAPGLWLSFGAVAAILYLNAGLPRATANGHGHAFSRWRELLKLQLMLSLMLAPLTLFFFQGASGIAPLANLLALPAMALLLPALLSTLLFTAAWPAAGLPLLQRVADAIAAAFHGLQWLADQSPQTWIDASVQPAALLLAGTGIVLLGAPRGLPLGRVALLCFVPMLWPQAQAPQRGFELTALDVGQGLAVVVRTAQHALLFDAGPAYEQGFDAGRSVVVPYLLQAGLHRLDLMMISHADLDHRGGAPAVRKLLDVVEERGAMAGIPCEPGQHWSWDAVEFSVLNGPGAAAAETAASAATGAETNRADANKPARGHAHNNEGCVLRIVSGAHAALLPADIERGSEAQLLSSMPASLQADVLVAPHHGSKTSSTADFVRAVAPRLVIFPAGLRNQFGHPRAEVVARYQALGAQLLMTGHSGAISLRVDPDAGIADVQEWRRAAPRLWSAEIPPIPTDNQ